MELTLSEMAAIAEIIAAIAIVISLIFVGRQLRDNTRATRSANTNASWIALQNFYLYCGSSSESSSVFYKGLTNPSELSREQLAQYIYILHSAVLALQNTHSLAREGSLDLETLESVTNHVLAVRDTPGFNLYWSQRKSFFTERFRNFIEKDIFLRTEGTEAGDIYKIPETISE